MSSSAHNPYVPPPAPYKPWFSRNWKWFVPVLAISGLLVVGLFAIGIVALATSMMRSSDAYRMAVERAERSPLVWAKIGHPFRVGRFVSGSINVSGDSGEADLSIPISGTQGAGHIVVSGKKRAGQWTFQTLEVHVDGDGTVIPLLGPGGGEAAPADDSV